MSRAAGLGNDNFNNINNVNANNQFNNNGRSRNSLGKCSGFLMKTYKNIFEKAISLENLDDAYWKARKGKYMNPVVQEFHRHWRLHLIILHNELKNKTYVPQPMKTFILRDPKTRKISVSAFRDRVVHHALVNVLQPIFEPSFIYDSFASRKGKGNLEAVKRFEMFKRKVSRNNARSCVVLKADIRQYFDTVDHEVLIAIIQRKILDERLLWLVRRILCNYSSKKQGKGMPLGNWTSQFFANVYLNELDQFVKHQLKAKYYIRYVDDFVILHVSKEKLIRYRNEVACFLSKLKLELHPSKCTIKGIKQGIHFLGFRIFARHKLLKKTNIRKFWHNLASVLYFYRLKLIEYGTMNNSINGWFGYALHANTHSLRRKMLESLSKKLTSPFSE